ncbi:phospholipase D-like domain-containing protein [Thalassoglobus sp. JC818]|uniref:phospholipase D-like domain-containing protein n=1 Tax=Thalassoglobus sp. JC818 TaxID=3232136 RepID=UPI00345AA4B6
MRIEIPDVTGQLVLSKDDFGYQEVIDQIGQSETVSVVTYNISNGNEGLLQLLRDCDAEVRLITNIPGRFKDYTSDNAKKRARNKMKTMFRKLDPERFGAFARVLFCFRNHAKIILTDTVAYVGSANYSEESSSSWEGGIIVRDSSTISQISQWVDEIESDSVRFYGQKMPSAITPLLLVKSQLEALGAVLEGEFTNDDVDKSYDAFKAVEDAVSEKDRAWAEAYEPSGPLSSQVDMKLLRSIEDWTGNRDTLDLARTNEDLLEALDGEISVDEFKTDNDGNIPESEFEGYIERLTEEQKALCERHKEGLIAVQQQIETVCVQIESACKEISTHIARINNAE